MNVIINNLQVQLPSHMYLPNELINIILSFREKHPIAKYMNYLMKDCYVKYTSDFWDENEENSEFLFLEWYFLYRKWWGFKKYKNIKYKFTPINLYIY